VDAGHGLRCPCRRPWGRDGTAEIADELFLSAHTVRDHVKAIFAKVGVSSRGELVARLFAEYYQPAHLQDVVRAHRN
jgi:predicted transcriptional regulator